MQDFEVSDCKGKTFSLYEHSKLVCFDLKNTIRIPFWVFLKRGCFMCQRSRSFKNHKDKLFSTALFTWREGYPSRRVTPSIVFPGFVHIAGKVTLGGGSP